MEKTYLDASADGLRLATSVIKPEGRPVGVLQLAHGMCDHKERYYPFMQHMAQHGYVCVVHDHRGHGETVKTPGDLGYMYSGGWRAMVEDLHIVNQWIHRQYSTLPLFMLQNSFQSFLATAEKPGFGLKVTVFAGLTNVVLDFLLVYVLSLGLAGAALATALSQAVGAAIPLAYFLRENDTPLRLGRPCFDLRALWRACCNGSSEMVSNLSGSLVGILYNVQLMAIAQEDGVSAYGVLMYVDFIFKAFFFGYSIAVTPVVGYHYGAQNHAELKSLLRKSLIITVLVSLVMTGASVTLAGPIADLFVGYDAALHDMTVNALRIYSVSFLVFGFNIFGSAFFTGLNDGTDSALISFLRTLVFQVAAILLLPRWLDINGIWLAVTAAESLTLLVTVSLLAAKRRKYHY